MEGIPSFQEFMGLVSEKRKKSKKIQKIRILLLTFFSERYIVYTSLSNNEMPV